MEQSPSISPRLGSEKINILVVDDQPAKLLSYEVILSGIGATLIKASSACEAFECLLKSDVALILIDVCMPEIDGFELAALIREHPRFQRIAIIFVSALMHGDLHKLRGYALGAVDYIPVPLAPELLRAKVKVFLELHQKTRQLEALNALEENADPALNKSVLAEPTSSGTSLGFSIAQAMATRFGGLLALVSAPNAVTCANLWLPRAFPRPLARQVVDRSARRSAVTR